MLFVDALDFYPRPPRGGRRAICTAAGALSTISIHALREEGDWLRATEVTRNFNNFYPRPPRGGRRDGHTVDNPARVFLSTPSARRATRRKQPFTHLSEISIHALREEGDITESVIWNILSEFLSTPSARRATMACNSFAVRRRYFYPRPPRGGRRRHRGHERGKLALFLSTPSARRATYAPFRRHSPFQFLSTPSARRATLCVKTN